MDTIENCLAGLPILICSAVNQKCQLLNPRNPIDIFTSRQALEHLHPSKLELFFDIFLKDRDEKKKEKILVEKIKLEIHAKDTDTDKKEDVNMKNLYIKLCLLKKSINSFIMNSPFFSYLIQTRPLEIQPSSFEAVCSLKSEISCPHFENIQLKNLNIEGYAITITLYTIPSHFVAELVDDYILGSEMLTLLPGQNIDRSNSGEDEDSWDMALDSSGYHIVTQKEEANKTHTIIHDSYKRSLPDQNCIMAEQENFFIKARKSPERKIIVETEDVLESKENKENKEDLKTDKQILEAILLEAQNLKKFSDRYNWGKETAYDVLLKENNLYDKIKNV